ncbi:hypothetical protein E4T56_gene8542 [Termitomyces sp. T112]|nr:hypothetical protein E4T56_gene8542 [Termitomyces sp. T112]
MKKITSPMVLAVLRKIEERGAQEMARRVRGHISDVFSWAIGHGMADQDPSLVVRKALMPVDTSKRPALIEISAARELLGKVHGAQDARWATRLASTLLPLTAARPGVVRLAERHEFEDLHGPKPIWRISAEKMKLTRQRKRDATYEFIIPLAPQTVEIVRAAIKDSRSEKYLFAGIYKDVPISDSTISKLYRENGYAGRHVPHGWRASFSTIMNRIAAEAERPSDREIVDLMLAHIPRGVEPIYNRYLYMPPDHRGRPRMTARSFGEKALSLVSAMGAALSARDAANGSSPRSGQPVWRNSYYEGQFENRLWRPVGIGRQRGTRRGAARLKGAVIKAAEALDLRTRKARKSKTPDCFEG